MNFEMRGKASYKLLRHQTATYDFGLSQNAVYSAALVWLDPATEIRGKHLAWIFAFQADCEKAVPVLADRVLIEFLELLRGAPAASNFLRHGQKFSRGQSMYCEHICVLSHCY